MPISRRLLVKTFVDLVEQEGVSAKLVTSFAAYLFETGHAKHTDLVINDIIAEFARRGRVLAHVTTAHPLKGTRRPEIEKWLKHTLGAHHIELTEEVEPKIIGGIKVSLPGLEMDATLKSQLQALRGVKNNA